MGAEIFMSPVDAKIGTTLTKIKNLFLILYVGFVPGVAVTAAEPDLQMLAKFVPHIDTALLLVAVGAGRVTTGSMTVPFIPALGVGLAHIRSDAACSPTDSAWRRCALSVPCLPFCCLGCVPPVGRALLILSRR